jgi:two-component system sensor histidine kinase TctE
LDTPDGPVLEVEDDGPGIPAAALPGLLSRQDVRADTALGTHGLGLSVVSEIARLFGARLDFVTAPTGRGQVVRACFPARSDG